MRNYSISITDEQGIVESSYSMYDVRKDIIDNFPNENVNDDEVIDEIINWIKHDLKVFKENDRKKGI